jgi:hypothetical protein
MVSGFKFGATFRSAAGDTEATWSQFAHSWCVFFLSSGNYSFYIRRAGPVVQNIQARVTGTYGSWAPMSGLKTLTPPYSNTAGPTVNVYVFNVTYKYGWVEIRPYYTGGAVTIDSGATGLGPAVGSGNWSGGMWLTPAAWNTFHVCSDLDGNYTLVRLTKPALQIERRSFVC